MIFSELYSVYYNTVAKILSAMVEEDLDSKQAQKIVEENAFGDSSFTIMNAIKSEKWQVMTAEYTTAIEHIPTMPLTTLQKRWLKAISLDPRIKLFGINFEGLDDVEPLFTQEDYYVFDRYNDGDNYEDKAYIGRFRFILNAIRNKTPVKINMKNVRGQNIYAKCLPLRLEYSEKDDKFRLITTGCRFLKVINLSKIVSVARCNGEFTPKEEKHHERTDSLTLKITDDRNALERVMLHFAHFEKRAEKLDRRHYLVHIKYDHADEMEMVIRILSFGPLVEVIEPEPFIELMRNKLQKQFNCKIK